MRVLPARHWIVVRVMRRTTCGQLTGLRVAPHVQTAIGDFDGDGRDDLAVGAYGAGSRPLRAQAGAVRVYYDYTAASGSRAPAVLVHADHRSRFGWAMAAADVNLDGVTE